MANRASISITKVFVLWLLVGDEFGATDSAIEAAAGAIAGNTTGIRAGAF